MPLRKPCGLLVALAVVLPATAAAAAPQATVIGGDVARTVKVEAEGKERVARLSLLVRNDSSRRARPVVRFVPATAAKAKVDFTAQTEVLRPGQVGPVEARFALSGGADLKGTLLIGLGRVPGARDAAVPVASEAPPSSAVVVEPGEITVHVTRKCPGWVPDFACGGRDDAVAWVSTSVVSGADKVALKRLAASGSGGSATVELKPIAKPSAELKRLAAPAGVSLVKVMVDARRHGEYSTTFALGKEGAKDGQLKVTADVQDWWLWPLLVLIAGAVLGYLTRWLMGSYRDRRLLEGQLRRERNSYSRRVPGRSPGVYSLDEWFGGLADPVPGIPSRATCRTSDDLQGFSAVWCVVRAARSSEDIEAARVTVERLATDLSVWRRVNAALKRLDSAFESAVPDPAVREQPIPAYLDVRQLTGEPGIPVPKDVAQAEAWMKAMRAHEEVLVSYERARKAWARVDPNSQSEYAGQSPETIYGEAGKLLDRTPEQTFELECKLLEAARELEPRATLPSQETVPPRDRVEERQPLSLVQRIGAVLPDRVARSIGMTVTADSLPPQDPDVGRLQRVTSLIDWGAFAATLLVSAVVYLLTLYEGEHFGGVSQYVQAFGAGFAGQALVGVATIPFARSLVAIVAKKPG